MFCFTVLNASAAFDPSHTSAQKQIGVLKPSKGSACEPFDWTSNNTPTLSLPVPSASTRAWRSPSSRKSLKIGLTTAEVNDLHEPPQSMPNVTVPPVTQASGACGDEARELTGSTLQDNLTLSTTIVSTTEHGKKPTDYYITTSYRLSI
jgi:hypothetical protein